MNSIKLLGHLTRDPELTYTPNNVAVCNFRLACNRRYLSNDQITEETCFIDITTWGNQAVNAKTYLMKGRKVIIEGYLKFDQWTDTNTQETKQRHSIMAEKVHYLDKPNRLAQQTAPVPQPAAQQ